MKKTLCLLMILALAFSLSGCSSTANKLEKHLELNFPTIEEITEEDSHGGFLGDGKLFIKIKFENGTLEEQLKGWNKLPLTPNIEKAVYGSTEKVGEDEIISFGSLFADEEGKTEVPLIENGYYYFYDRHSESDNPFSDEYLHSRYSYNFTLAMYDCDNHTLYYMEFDT